MFDKIYQPYQIIFKAGDAASTLYEIHGGQVLCLKEYNRRLVPVYLACAGDTVGENAMIPFSSYDYHAVALVQTQVSQVQARAIHQDLSQSAAWLAELLSTMLKRSAHTTNLISENRVCQFEGVFTDQIEIELKRLLGLTR